MKKQSMFHQSAFRMNRVAQAARALAALAAMASPGLALADMSFPSAPPMATSSAGVMPNVIIAVDGTGSMGAVDAPCTKGSVKDVNGNTYSLSCSGSSETRLNALGDALLTTFSDQNLVGKIRFAFIGTARDAGFGPYRFNPSTTDNSMKVFTADYQTKFLQWASNYKNFNTGADGCNPTEPMVAYAGEYLRGNWLNNANTNFICEWGAYSAPWTNVNNSTWKSSSSATMIPAMPGGYPPGVGASPKPDYYLNFTGVPDKNSPWNSNNNLRTNLTAHVSGGVDSNDNSVAEGEGSRLACRRSYLIFMTDGGVNGNQFAPVGTGDNNYDNSLHHLPDGNTYDPADPNYGPLYSDYSANNYADHTLYYWATDLTGKGTGVVSTSNAMPITDDQKVTYNGKSVTFTPYWNPQNDPATWQHMQTFTVGFGTSGGAGQLPKGQYNNPKGDQWPYSQPGGNDITTSYATSYSPVNIPMAFDSMYGSMFSFFATNSFSTTSVPLTSSWPWVSDVDNGYSWQNIGVTSVVLDLFHAAYNGRGQYFPAVSVADLSTAFSKILQSAITQSAPGGVASATASNSRLTSGGAVAYAAGYTYDSSKANNYSALTNAWTGDGIDGWIGSLTAYDGSNVPSGVEWTASIPLTRQILTANASGSGIIFQFGAPNLTAADGIDAATVSTVRKNPLGDIVNSQLAFVGKASRMSMDSDYITFAHSVAGRESVVYVGANDGMLHGFDAGDGTTTGNVGSGKEVMAYVPRGLLGRLSAFTAPGSYSHNYWVDGSPFSGDAQVAGAWKTVLTGTLGAGGKGYFVLDVTTPPSESSPSSAVLVDYTDPGSDTTGSYIGYQFNAPVMDMYTSNQSAQIVKLNTKTAGGEWGIIMGNGYNSASGLPVLLIQSLSGSKQLYTIPASCADLTACKTAGNGLSAPRPVDVDGNGTADIVYAGDLMGNLWKFDISDPAGPSQWKVTSFFKAVGPSSVAQPITSAPAVVPDAKNGGLIVAFGTGKNLVTGDQSDVNLNSVYALYDHQSMELKTTTDDASNTITYVGMGDSAPITCTNRSCLYQHTGNAMGIPPSSGVIADGTDAVDNEKFDGSSGSRSGWYFDIPDVDNGNAAKVLLNPLVLSGNTLVFYSTNVTSASGGDGPAAGTETCNPTGKLSGAITTINYFDLLTGNVPDNTFTVNGLTFGGDSGSDGNRFRIDGVQTFIPNGADSAQGVEANTQTQSKAKGPAGAQAGWRITGR